MYEFKLPDLGEGIHEGEILKWHVEVNAAIKEDDPLVDVETDKAAVIIPSPRAGKIVRLVGNVGDILTVGQVITVIDETRSENSGAQAPDFFPFPVAGNGRETLTTVPTGPRAEEEEEHVASLRVRSHVLDGRLVNERGGPRSPPRVPRLPWPRQRSCSVRERTWSPR